MNNTITNEGNENIVIQTVSSNVMISSIEESKDIIELDKDTIEQDGGEETLPFPYDPIQEDIDIREDKMPIYKYMDLYKNERLKIDPDYQRNSIWSIKQKSRFIESIMLNFPLPPIYVNQQKNGKYIIIDGLQRTTTLQEFTTNKFLLSDLKALPSYNGQSFNDLPDVFKARIEGKPLLLYILKPSVPTRVIYELFNRINTGGTPLNRQEIRNSIFEGQSTKLLKELASNEIYGFCAATDNGVSPKRMKDREIILRYLAFKLFDYKNDYNGDISKFIESTMSRINNLSELDIQDLKNDFRRVMHHAYDFFGFRNYRLPVLDNTTSKIKSRGAINICMFESINYFFSTHSDAFLLKNKTKIIANYDRLLNNEQYRDAVSSSTSAKFRVINRFELVQNILGAV